MADLSAPSPRTYLRRIDKALATLVLILLALAVFRPAELWPTVSFALQALLNTAPFITFAVLAIGVLKASGGENLLARAFVGRETRMIVLAALLGGLSPFCSCEVIPFIAALLAVGAPLSAVMAFWLSSPLMDPAMFLILTGTLGLPFAVGKTLAAVGLGLFGGFITMSLENSALLANPLRTQPKVGGCCGVKKPFSGQPVWAFWNDADRRRTFRDATLDNALFLLKWLALAYTLEALMIRHIPADLVANLLGGGGVGTILLAALVGAPAYMNGYAAVPLIDALLQQGMSQGAAMSFMIAGGVSSIPAAIAVWALVKPRVFSAYLGLAVVGSVLAGLAWQIVA
jgi:uncharacterized membrane protein YraQ (UPF0718 family)